MESLFGNRSQQHIQIRSLDNLNEILVFTFNSFGHLFVIQMYSCLSILSLSRPCWDSTLSYIMILNFSASPGRTKLIWRRLKGFSQTKYYPMTCDRRHAPSGRLYAAKKSASSTYRSQPSLPKQLSSRRISISLVEFMRQMGASQEKKCRLVDSERATHTFQLGSDSLLTRVIDSGRE